MNIYYVNHLLGTDVRVERVLSGHPWLINLFEEPYVFTTKQTADFPDPGSLCSYHPVP